jgi:hypothetical protein
VASLIDRGYVCFVEILFCMYRVKGTVSRYFCHHTIPSGPLISRLKPFRMWLRIREVIRLCRWFSGVNDTAVADNAYSAQKHSKFYYPVAITTTQKYRGYLSIGDFIVEYLCEFEAIRQKSLIRESGA